MKKVIVSTLAALALAVAATSCTTVVPVQAANASLTKRGEASGKYLFGYHPLAGADVSIATAAKNGGITKVGAVDQKITIGFLTVTKTTIVSGE